MRLTLASAWCQSAEKYGDCRPFLNMLLGLKRPWKYILAGLGVCILLVIGLIWYFLAGGPLTVSNGTLSLTSLTNTVEGPVAKLQAVDPWYVKKTDVVNSVTLGKIYVFRHGKWSEDPGSLNVQWLPLLRRGNRAIKGGNTLEVGVPVCEKWRLEFTRRERRKVRSKLIPIQFWITTRWNSEEMPGWSQIKNEFNVKAK
jgi:hypothetical protein